MQIRAAFHYPPRFTFIYLTLWHILIVSCYLQGTHAYERSRISSNTLRPASYYRAIGKIHDMSYKCQLHASPHKCYGVQQIRNAYSIASLLEKGITGAGRSIVLVDAYRTPHLHEDVADFNNLFSLPAASLRVIAPYRVPAWKASDKLQVDWSSETTLDVEWSHAIAPGASITLVEAKSENDIDLFNALNYAVEKNLGDVISMSFGEGENCMDPHLLELWHKTLKVAFKKKITMLASSGDSGAAQQSCDGNSWEHAISVPASDPLVTSVGGTILDADAVTGKYNNEVAWNEPAKNGATGGGFSEAVKLPFYQTQVPATMTGRGIPDVAYNSSVLSGVITVWSDGPKGSGGVYSFGGTSAGTPQWAAIIALADEYSSRRVGFINAALYWIGKSPRLYHSSFHDISSGNNTITLSATKGPSITIQGYDAQPNWDPTTGLGSPIVSELVPLLSELTISSGTDLWNYKKN